MFASKSTDMIQVKTQLDLNGFCIVENVVPEELRARLKSELASAIDKEVEYHKSREYQDFGMVLFCPLYGSSFVELLDLKKFIEPVELVMGENCILYSYTSTSMPPSATNYSSRIHIDCQHHIPEGYATKFQTLTALDDFTLENGATYVLPGSHRSKEKPSEEYFFANAVRLTMKAGSVWFAHSNLWHAGGMNSTNNWRHAITSVFCRSYMKQRIDIPKLMGEDFRRTISSHAEQKLGYLAQVPQSYDEYYAPTSERKFRQPLD